MNIVQELFKRCYEKDECIIVRVFKDIGDEKPRFAVRIKVLLQCDDEYYIQVYAKLLTPSGLWDNGIEYTNRYSVDTKKKDRNMETLLKSLITATVLSNRIEKIAWRIDK